MAYNFDKNTCDKCRITKDKVKKKMLKGSLRLGQDGSVLCSYCHKEKLLKDIMKGIKK